MSELLNNNAKFEMFQIDHDKDFNYVLNYRKKVIIVLKDLNKDEITEVDYNHMYPSGCLSGILYGFVNVH